MELYEKINKSVEFLKSKINIDKIDMGIVLGSGLGNFTERIENKITIPYKDIPYFPETNVKGHNGNLLFGKIGDKNIVAMEGRFHFYEGHSMKDVTYPFYVLNKLNLNSIIITNAAGGVNKEFIPGDIMIINDFINFMGTNPLIGKNDERFGERFPDMTTPYDENMINGIKKIAVEKNIDYKEGVYCGTTGPYFETKSEVRAFSILGADAVGMSTVPDTIVCNYLGMKVLGISCITNMATGIQLEKHNHLNVLKVANEASEKICLLVEEYIKRN